MTSERACYIYINTEEHLVYPYSVNLASVAHSGGKQIPPKKSLYGCTGLGVAGQVS